MTAELRILLVDDEPQVLDALRRQFGALRPGWDVRLASGGEPALEELERGAFDAVVTDLRMPGIDGGSLLEFVQARFPETCRVAISGYIALPEVARSLRHAHQHLSKPCRGLEVVEAVERALARRDQVRSEALRRIVGDARSIPSAPRVYARISRMLGDADSSIWQIADAVAEDPALAAKVLQIANSAYLGLRARVNSIEMAASMLGTNLLRGLVLTAEVYDGFSGSAGAAGVSVDVEQQHAVRVARLAVSLDGWAAWREDAFAAGLLHDVGRLLLAARLGAPYAEIHATSRSTGVPIHVLERDQLGADHAGVGGHLLGLWGLPPEVVDAVARHHDASLARGRELDAVLAVHVADRLDRAVETGTLETLVEREASHDPRWLTWAERAFTLDRNDEAA